MLPTKGSSRPPQLTLCCLAAACPLPWPADLLQGMLKFRAGDRITAAEALQHPFFQLQL